MPRCGDSAQPGVASGFSRIRQRCRMLYSSRSCPKMAEAPAEIEIPKRALFKAAEVCELLKVQPYVLRSWESEFPDLGIAKTAGAPRLYRRADVEQVRRIKHL